jgi:hypothetical protein
VASSKTKTLFIVLAVLVLAVALGAGAFLYIHSRPLPGSDAGSAPGIFSMLPADAPLLAYLDAAALKTNQNSALSAIGQLVLPAPQQDRDYVEFVRNTGFDYSRDLDHAAVAIWPSNFGSPSGTSPGAPDDNKTLAIADGKFDAARIKAYALKTGRTVSVDHKTVYEVPGVPPISFEFLSPTRVELASGKEATRLLQTRAVPPDAVVQARINRVAGAPFFAVARTDNLPDAFYANLKNSAQLLALIRSIQGITAAGQPQGDNLAVTLDAECDSMKNALAIGTLLEGFRMFGSAALADPKARGQMTKDQAAFLNTLLAHVKVTPQNNFVRLSIELTPAMLSGPPRKPSH